MCIYSFADINVAASTASFSARDFLQPRERALDCEEMIKTKQKIIRFILFISGD